MKMKNWQRAGKAVAVACVGLVSACASGTLDKAAAEQPRYEAHAPLKAERPLVALVLGSGGARGFAHVGVIKALEQGGVVPDIVTGTSSGAVVAALYAAGYPAARLEEIALELDEGSLIDFNLFGRGWVRGEALQEFVNRATGNRPIEQLTRPLAVVATAAKSGRMTVFNRGNTGLAVRASSSVPDLFIPPIINGEEYLDGGLTNPVPAGIARRMGADIVIAVDLTRYSRQRALADVELTHADIVIRPETTRTRILDFDGKAVNIAAGAEAAREALPKIVELVKKAGQRKGSIAQAAAHPPTARLP